MTVGPAQLRGFLARGTAAVIVEITRVLGSAPREAGAWMLVDDTGILGSIGGGQLEFQAMARARALLAEGRADAAFEVPLGPDIGQCCGGRVAIAFRRLDGALAEALAAQVQATHDARPHVYVFGAGHVGRALGRALAPLPFRTVIVDSRAVELDAVSDGVEALPAPLPEAVVRRAPGGAAFVIVTHAHDLDFLIAGEALARRDSAYVGMIGSKTKRAAFGRWLAGSGGDAAALDRLVMPIGGAVKDKRPEVIAALTAAELARAMAAYGDLA